MGAARTDPPPARGGGWVWFDLENTPHVLFLEPLIRRLAAAGIDVRASAKPQAQTLELAALRSLACVPVGGGDFGRGRFEKVIGGTARALALVRWVLRQGSRPALLVSSSRSASVAAWLLRIPGVALLDYEHAEQRTIALNGAVWLPDLLRDATLAASTRAKGRFYPGLKENLYLDSARLDRDAERRALGVPPDVRLVVARPAAETAHYASGRSQRLWLAAVRGLASQPGVRVLVVPRTATQREQLNGLAHDGAAVEILARAVDGAGLVAAADLVLGGGGTMNREAAVLGVPAWSTFHGPAPFIDECLAREGRLRWLRDDAEVRAALAGPWPSRAAGRGPFPDGLETISADLLRSVRA